MEIFLTLALIAAAGYVGYHLGQQAADSAPRNHRPPKNHRRRR